MRELHYVEGKNLLIEWRSAGGNSERVQGLAAELVQLKVDVIVTAGTAATRAAQKATTAIPIVMVYVGAPVGIGFVKSLARPGGNITGLSTLADELGAKHFQMLLSMVTNLSPVAVLSNPVNPTHAMIFKSVQTAAERHQNSAGASTDSSGDRQCDNDPSGVFLDDHGKRNRRIFYPTKAPDCRAGDKTSAAVNLCERGIRDGRRADRLRAESR